MVTRPKDRLHGTAFASILARTNYGFTPLSQSLAESTGPFETIFDSRHSVGKPKPNREKRGNSMLEILALWEWPVRERN